MGLFFRRKVLAAAGTTVALGAHAAPEPVRGKEGADIIGPRNDARQAENPNLTSPPKTDHGALPNLRWSFADSHMRIEPGGWARETTVRELPISTEIAGVNMRLDRGGVREMHWHKASEWSYMLAGTARITAIDQDGRTFADDVNEGDLWFFPAGIPHSIQGLGEQGCEFLLVFDDGSFSEDNTFLLTDWFAHTPRDVLARNFGVPEAALANIPSKERYIFQAPVPGALQADVMSDNRMPQTFSHRMTAQDPQRTQHGAVRIADRSNFPISTTAAALVDVEPGGMRELHWHPNAAEWQYWIEGTGCMTVFASGGNARTFDFQAGDVGFVPFAMGHYVQNTGSTRLRFLEMFKSPRYADLSLARWLALTPPELVRAHLNVDDAFIQALHRDKRPVVG